MPTYTRVSNYGYTPDLTWNAIFVSLFGLSLLIHCYQAYRTRFWIVYPTLALGALIELMGYSARLWSHFDVLRLDAFLMQIVLLTFAPVFFSAYVYILLGTAIHRLGPTYSILPPKLYFITFITADILSLVLQAIGGGQAASTAARQAPSRTAEIIAVSGIVFQLAVMFCFMSCGLDFAVRIWRGKEYAFRARQERRAAERQAVKDSEKTTAPGIAMVPATEVESDSSAQTRVGTPVAAPNKAPATYSIPAITPEDKRKWLLITFAVFVCSAMILLRGFFRSIELSYGYTGYLAQKELYMALLDGVPMVIAVVVFNVVNPGMILGRKSSWAGYY